MITVASGDHLQFVLAEVGGNACDSTTWDPRISYTEGWIETTATYDVYGNQLTTTDADANAGNTTHTGCTVTGSTSAYSTCMAYDSTFHTLPLSTTNALNQTGSVGYTSTAAGGFGLWPTSTTDANGQITTSGYDALGRPTDQTLPSETSGLTTTSTTYTDWCSGANAQSPCVEVDQTQRLDSSTTVTTRTFYDGYGRWVETRMPGPNGQDVVRFGAYDAQGRVAFESIAYFVAAYTGAPGQAAFSIPDSTQAGTSYTYPNLHSTTVTDALSDATTSKTAAVCNASGTSDSACYRQATTIDPLGHQSSTLTDAFGREIYDQRYTGNSTATYQVYATTKYSYNVLGKLIQILHPDGSTITTIQYDQLGRQIGMNDPDRGTESNVYDANGNPVQVIDARGGAGTIYAGYDGLNRQLWQGPNSNGSNPYVSCAYDSTANGNIGVGRLTGETFTGGSNQSLSGSYSDVYDARGQETQTTLTVGGTSYPIQTSYDDAGDVLSQTYPNGDVLTTSYTAQGWLAGLTLQQGSTQTTLLSNLSYTGTSGAAGLASSASLNGGTYTETSSYDLLLRLGDWKVTRSSDQTTLFEEGLSYDSANRVTEITTTLPQGSDVQHFCYDEQDRLTWAGSVGTPPCTGTAITPGSLTTAEYTQSFAYDTLGRLTSGPQGSYAYGNSTHIHAATAIGSSYTASYDAAGNMTCRAPTSAATCTGSQPTGAQLSYDNEGNLIAWQNMPNNPTSTATYLYDGEGNRVEQQTTQGGTTTTTVYVGSLEEVTTTGTTTTTKTYYGQVAMSVNGVLSYLVSDGLGSITEALDTSGNVEASQLYGPYGGGRYSTGTMPTNYGFTGQRQDVVTGLDYYGARYYDPLAGQFISADTVLPGGGYDPWGLSRYAYVGGNPISRVDPTGHDWWGDFWNSVGSTVHDVANNLFNVDQMWSDLQTLLTDTNFGDRLGAGIDLAANFLADEFFITELAGPMSGGHSSGPEPTDEPTHEPTHDPTQEPTHDPTQEPTHDPTSGCGQSFSADTLVATPQGEQPISSLRVGDQVQAYDPQTQQQSTQTVEQVWINHDTDLLDVTLQETDTKGAQLVAQQEGKNTPTGYLPPTVARAEQTNADRGTGSARNTGVSVTTLPQTTQDETIHTTASHPWLTVDQGWVRAGDLKVGEPVIGANGKSAVVVAVHVIVGAGIRYDLTVSHIHTFEVGDGRWVVHNCGNDPPNYTDTTDPEKTDQKPDEKDAGKYVASIKPDAEVIQRDPPEDANMRIRNAYFGNTSDLTVNGINYDIVSPEPGTSIRNILTEVAAKTTQARGIVINLSRTNLTVADFNNVYNRVRGFMRGFTPPIPPDTLLAIIFYDPKSAP